MSVLTEPLADVEMDVDLAATVPCEWFRPCAAEAAWIGTHTCCGVEFKLCDIHRDESRRDYAEMKQHPVACAHCRTEPMPEPAWRPV